MRNCDASQKKTILNNKLQKTRSCTRNYSYMYNNCDTLYIPIYNKYNIFNHIYNTKKYKKNTIYLFFYKQFIRTIIRSNNIYFILESICKMFLLILSDIKL